jgi:hypothetical protein
MADQFSGCEADKVLDLRTIVGCLAEVLPKGPAQTALYWVAGLCILAAPFIYKYYFGVLAQGTTPEGSLERQDYDKLRTSLAGGNLAARLYVKWLTAFLDWIEQFFGDFGLANRTPFLPRFLRLRDPAPLWTAPAFDRCLLLALVYPIATIFLIWAISGHVGPAEAALGFEADIPGWARSLSAGAFGLGCLAFWRAFRTRTLNSWASLYALGTAGVFAGALMSAGAFAIAVAAVGAAFTNTFGFGGAGAVAVAFVVVAGVVAGVVADAFTSGGAFAIAVAAVGAAVAGARAVWSTATTKPGVFLLLYLSAMISACLGMAAVLSPLKIWELAGPLLLFLGLLTLLNAPFDWASLGLTRALLRRGLELGGWWPYILGLVDAALASVIIACLALVMVIGVQAFDELAVHGGGKPVLPLDTLFDGIAQNPAAPEYWWAYALLLSTMIPSLVNLAIGGMAFTRGIPWLGRFLLLWIPEGKAIPEYRRQLAAIGVTTQMFAGAFLGIAAQAFLAWGLIFHVMLWIGLDLLDMARAVAAFDLPMQLWQIFARIL